VLAATFAASSALAQQERQEVLVGKHHVYASPQHFAFELRISPFLPDIDSDPSLNGATPFADIFGGKQRIMLSGEFDWQTVRIPHLGTLGPGLGFGYFEVSGNAPLQNPTAGGATTSGETTKLEIFPLYLAAVLRADVLWRDLGIPFVPYAKAGPAVSFWRASNTLGTSQFQGTSGKGYTLGAQLALGVGFNLNVFDEYAAKNFDEAMGVNNTYLFGEWTDADLNGLGFQSDPLRVGGQYWTFGLAFEF
jgi:hypothetical protein